MGEKLFTIDPETLTYFNVIYSLDQRTYGWTIGTIDRERALKICAQCPYNSTLPYDEEKKLRDKLQWEKGPYIYRYCSAFCNPQINLSAFFINMRYNEQLPNDPKIIFGHALCWALIKSA